MLLKYADDEMKMFKERANDGNDLAEDRIVVACLVAAQSHRQNIQTYKPKYAFYAFYAKYGWGRGSCCVVLPVK